MADRRIVRKSDLGRLEQLARGGTARIYRAPDMHLPDFPDMVYKEYRRDIRQRAGPALLPGLLSVIKVREDLKHVRLTLWDARIVWPLKVVTDDDDSATGILMRIIPARYFQPITQRIGPPKPHPRHIHMLFGDPADMRRDGLPDTDLLTRVGMVARIVATFHMLHQENVVYGDVSGQNFVYDTSRAQPSVLAVDADTARVAMTRAVFKSQPHTPHWEPPEVLQAKLSLKGSALTDSHRSRLANEATAQNKATDVYKFALLVVRILDFGRRQTQNRDPGTAARVIRRFLGDDAARLLRDSLDPDARRRPSMAQWYDITHGGADHRANPEKPAVRREGRWTFQDGIGWIRDAAGRP